MGKIKVLKEEELVGSTSTTPVYPVTAAQAVYTSNNETVEQVLADINSKINMGTAGSFYCATGAPFYKLHYNAHTKIVTATFNAVLGIYGHASESISLWDGPHEWDIKEVANDCRCVLVRYFDSTTGFCNDPNYYWHKWLNWEQLWTDPKRVPIPIIVVEPMYGIVYRADQEWINKNIERYLPHEINRVKYAVNNSLNVVSLPVKERVRQYIEYDMKIVDSPEYGDPTTDIYDISDIEGKIFLESNTVDASHPLYGIVKINSEGNREVEYVHSENIDTFAYASLAVKKGEYDELWVMYSDTGYKETGKTISGYVFHDFNYPFTRVSLIEEKNKHESVSTIGEHPIKTGNTYSVTVTSDSAWDTVLVLPKKEDSKVGDTININCFNKEGVSVRKYESTEKKTIPGTGKAVCCFTANNDWRMDVLQYITTMFDE